MNLASQLDISILPRFILSYANLIIYTNNISHDSVDLLLKELSIAKDRLEGLETKVVIDDILRAQLTECLINMLKSEKMFERADMYLPLLVAGANADATLEDGTPLLFLKKPFINSVQPLYLTTLGNLFNFCTNINATDSNGNNILHYLVKFTFRLSVEEMLVHVDGNIFQIEKCIDRGVNVNNRNKDGISVLGTVVNIYTERSKKIGIPFALTLLLNGADPIDIINCAEKYPWVEELSANFEYILPKKGDIKKEYVSVLRCGHNQNTAGLFRRYAIDPVPMCLVCNASVK